MNVCCLQNSRQPAPQVYTTRDPETWSECSVVQRSFCRHCKHLRFVFNRYAGMAFNAFILLLSFTPPILVSGVHKPYSLKQL